MIHLPSVTEAAEINLICAWGH